MEVEYVHSEKVAFTPAHIQLACDGVYMALPFTRSSVGIWSIQDITYKVSFSLSISMLVMVNFNSVSCCDLQGLIPLFAAKWF